MGRTRAGAPLLCCLAASCGLISGLDDFELVDESSTTTTGSGSGGEGGEGGGPAHTTSSGGGQGTGGSGGVGAAGGGGSGAICGDGAVDAGEQCDDGNVTPADGCSAQCTQENPDTCPGPTIPLTTAGFVVMGDTTGAANDAGALPCGGAYTGDLVYEIFPSQDGTLTATLNGSFQTLLYARSACPGTANETIACSAMTTPATITMQVTAGKSYFVFVDGYGLAAEEGPFTLMLELN